MPPELLVARRFTFLTLLRLSLVVGAVYDLIYATLLVVAPELPNAMLRLPLPGPRFYLWTIAVFLTILAAVYLVAARDPRRYAANVVIAIAGRTLGFVAFAAAAWGHPELAGLWVIAFGDLTFAVIHLALWYPLRIEA